MNVYYGHPIDGGIPSEAKQFLTRLDALASLDSKICIYSPGKAFMVCKMLNISMEPFIVGINENALKACDLAVFLVAKKMSSWGVHTEIQFCIEHEIPYILVIHEELTFPLPIYMLRAMDFSVTQTIFTPDEACLFILQEANRGPSVLAKDMQFR